MVGGRTDVLDEVVEYVLKVACLKEALHAPVHRAKQIEFGELPQAVESGEIARRIQALLEIARVDEIVQVRRIPQEPFYRGGIFTDLACLLGHSLRFGNQVHHSPVLEEIAPMRTQGTHRNVIGHFLAGLLEQPFEDVRQGENGRAEVKGKTTLLEQVKLASNLGVLRPTEISYVKLSPPSERTEVCLIAPFEKTAISVVPPPKSMRAAPRFFSSFESTASLDASDSKTIS